MVIIFQISLYTLTCLASLMLAFAEQHAFAAITLPLACLSFFLTERMRTFSVSPSWASILGLLAFLTTGYEIWFSSAEVPLQSCGHLAVFLNWILLFQRKGTRQYWLMCALSVLQVALASIFTIDAFLGLLMMGYMILAIWTLSLFSMVQQIFKIGAAGSGNPVAAGSFDLAEIDIHIQKSEPVRVPARLSTTTFESQARGAVYRDLREKLISPRLTFVILTICIFSLCIGVVFFVFIPRVWYLRWSVLKAPIAEYSPEQTLTGFTPTVELGDMGQILESSERVLEVQLFDNDSDQEIDLMEYTRALGQEEPLFRGTVMGFYEKGRWKPLYRHTRGWVPYQTPQPKMIRQEIRMQPIGAPFLFAIHPVQLCLLDREQPRVGIHPYTAALMREWSISNDDPVTYNAYSSRIQQADDPPAAVIRLTRFSKRHFGSRSMYRRLPEKGLEPLINLVQERFGPNSSAPLPTPFATAQRIVAYLRDSGEFSYTLDASIQDPSIDPVVDFLINRKSGHCEYFASALTLMLRAAGIPSRMVSGFKGAEKNEITGKYIVQQRHAHTWVEAYFRDRWVVLDATPAGRDASVESFVGGTSLIRVFRHILSDLWFRNVVDMSISKQNTELYGPLQLWLKDRWKLPYSNFKVDPITNRPVSPESTDSSFWKNLLIIGIIALWVICIAGWRFRGSMGWVRKNGKSLVPFTVRGQPSTGRVDFYERFKKILMAHGIVRGAAQTPREFAWNVERTFRELLATHELSEFPNDLVERFYHIRFGSQSISADETREMNQTLERLQLCLTNKKTQQ